jgi:Beta-galactosidase/beta-glucuronidase
MFKGETDLPATNYTILLKEGRIPDPFFSANEQNLLWVAELDWIFTKKFVLTKEILASECVRLVFDNIDTVASVFLNGVKIADTENAFYPHAFDIKGAVVEGENEVKVYIYSPVAAARERQKKYNFPPNPNGLNGFSLIRKPGYHFGWDWGPVLPPSGFEGKVFLSYGNGPRIESVRIEQGFSRGRASLTVIVAAENSDPRREVNCRLFAPDGKRVGQGKAAPISESGGITYFTSTIVIDDPELWYPSGMLPGRKIQPIYSLKITADEDERELKIGFRNLELSRGSDGVGDDFCFVVNGKRVFAKGADWIPPDSFVERTDKEKLEYYFKNIADCGFNMLRVWGGGFYASEDFLDLADKYGILIWHDFMYACLPYPFFDKEFSKSAVTEAAYQIKRLRNRASLALFCGNNEIEELQIAWFYRKKIIDSNNGFFRRTLAELAEKLTTVPYWPSSPSSGDSGRPSNSDLAGDTHIWAVWHGMMPFEYFLKRKTRFCSEFGFESFPPLETVESFIEGPEELNIASPAMKTHQKGASGNERMLYYMIENYRIPKDFGHLVYLSQLTQAESTRVAVEHWRRNIGRCNGVLYWQLNDCWPTLSWSSIDYFGNFKALQYYAKEIYKPVAVSVRIKKGRAGVYLVNDSLAEISGTIRWRLATFDGKIAASAERSAAAEIYKCSQVAELVLKSYLPRRKFKDVALIAEFIGADGKIISSTNALLVSERNSSLGKAEIKADIAEGENSFVITAVSDRYARRVMPVIKGLGKPFSKSFFDLEAGIPLSFEIEKPCPKSLEELKKGLKFVSYGDIVPKIKGVREKYLKLRIALKPRNLFGKIAMAVAGNI